jgi:deoxyribodipyrimidine photolyase-like uncharacterized protein
MKQIVILEGQQNTSHKWFLKIFNDSYNCVIINNLYNNPVRLAALKFLEPEYVFVNPKTSSESQLKELSDYFKALDYVPKNIIFGSDEAEDSLMSLAKKYKSKGCNFLKLNDFDFIPSERI